MGIRWCFLLSVQSLSPLSIPAVAAESVNETAPPSWVLDAYAKKATDQTGIRVNMKDVIFEKTDLNGDGHNDWIVYSTISCGSAGCNADAYAYINNGYCYVGWTRHGDAPGALRNKYTNLKCQSSDISLEEPL